MRVLVTASRDWTDEWVIHDALDACYNTWCETAGDDDQFIVVHGDARGGDKIARRWAEERHRSDPRVDQEDHPANWELYGLVAGHRRNAEMVDTGVDRCLGFPLGKSPGTRGCMELAAKAGVQVKHYFPRPPWKQVSDNATS